MVLFSHVDNLSATLVLERKMLMADFIFYHNPAMNYHSLLELHAASMNVFTDLGQYNEAHGDLSGMCSNHIEITPDAVKHYIDVAGYTNDGYLQNRLDDFVPSYLGGLSQQQRANFCKTTTQVLQKLARDNYPSHTGSVTFFDWGTPRIYLFDNPDTESANTTPNPSKKHSVDQINEEEDTNSPLSTSADSLASQRRLLRQQVQIDDNNSHSDDDDLQVKPTSPSPNDNDNSLRQAINQQQQAIDDDDEKKKRDRRRQQRQRRKQRQLTQKEEAQIIRERCLKAEAKRNAELKHPTNKRRNSSSNASGRSHTPDGPEPFD